MAKRSSHIADITHTTLRYLYQLVPQMLQAAPRVCKISAGIGKV